MDESKKIARVAETLQGQRLDVALVQSGLVSTRSQGQKLIEEKKVKINSRIEKSSYKMQLGDVIEVEVLSTPDLELIPYDFPLDIVYEDFDVIVVNKPAGLVVHPAYGHQSDTLINALLFRRTQLSPSKDEFRPGLVHRIDKGTSGLLVLAKNEKAHNHLARQFLKKTIHRRYWALCFNEKKMGDGTFSSFLTRDPNHRQRFMVSVDEKGKWAITHYSTLKENEVFRLFELRLETGRTHQIRVHLSHAHSPIVGDEVYNGKNRAKNLKNQRLKKIILEMPRFALHARELGFNHPTTHENLVFKADLPEDLKELFEIGGFSEYI